MSRIKKALLCLIYVLFAVFAVAFSFQIAGDCGCGKYAEIPPIAEIPTQHDKDAGGKYHILIDVEESKLYLFESGKLIKTYDCSGGKPSTPSPIGVWRIVTKGTWGKGFGGRWMGLDVPWGKFGIHGTKYPSSIGRPSSKGCIRMRNADVRELYKLVPIGTKVIIVDGPYGPFGKGFRTLRPGMYGSDIREVQKKLKLLGYYNGSINGLFDSPGFLQAVQQYAKDNGFRVSNKITPELIRSMGFELMD